MRTGLAFLIFSLFFCTSFIHADLNWIWSSSKPKTEKAKFQKSFKIEGNVKSAFLQMSCDNQVTLMINGKKVVSSSHWNQPVKMNVKKYLKKGENKILLNCANEGTMAGMLLSLKINKNNGPMLIETDGSWLTQADNEKQFKPAAVISKYGSAPWGKVFDLKPSAPQNVSTPNSGPVTLPGFKAELLYTVPKGQQGSWVGMCSDAKGRLITCDQYGSLYRVTLGGEVAVEKLNFSVGKAHGLLYAFDSLYVLVNEAGKKNGVYRLKDTNGDDKFDKEEFLLHISSGGEHGVHSLVLSPDKQSIYLIAGNHSYIPKEVKVSYPARKWGEDHLMPRMPDGRGHATGRMAPGGFILKLDPEVRNPALVCYGFRNQFDAAFNAAGDLFTYDADMEYDFGSPWYRPARVNHVISGADYGWRYGTGKWPEYYADSLAATHNIGPGCPTGVSNGLGAKFPAKYQNAIYVNDWTYGTMYAVHFTPNGASYTAKREEFVSGKPLPLTDVIIHTDGHMYFLIGGRRTQSALYRISYVGKESTTPIAKPMVNMKNKLRRSLEDMHTVAPNPTVVQEAWEHLSDEDRIIRHTARVAIERHDPKIWKKKYSAETNSWTVIEASVALARVGKKTDQAAIIENLLRLDVTKYNGQKLLSTLRAYQIAFTRMGKPSAAHAAAIIKQLNPIYPHKENFANRELAQVLLYLDAPGAVSKTVAMVVSATEKQEKLLDDKVLARNDGYRRAALATEQFRSNTQQIALAFALRSVKNGWTKVDRLTYFSWFQQAKTWKGGSSFSIFIEKTRKEALANVKDEAFRKELDALSNKTNNKVKPITPPKGPGRAWTVAEAVKAVKGKLKHRNFKSGENLYRAGACVNCHRFAGDGEGIGPDLTASANRYTLKDMLENILEPSKVISDQYGSHKIVMKDGSEMIGRIGAEDKGVYHLMTNPFSADSTVKVKVSEVVKKEIWPVSPMPAGLVYSMNAEELSDLIAYIFSAGNPEHAYFKTSDAPAPVAKDGMTNLFDGKTLKGWSGDPELWKVENGVIVGDTFKKRTKANTFLIWEGEAEDFHLVYDAKIEGKNNSGMMYRSFYKNKKTWRLSGYQADIHPNPPYVAMLYGEGLGRGIIGQRGTKVHVEANGKPKVVGKTSEVTKIDISKWHTYEVICRGNRLIHKVDGKVALDLIDDHPKKLMKGLIGMQLHAGAPMKAFFKNIHIKKFKSQKVTQTKDDMKSLFDGKTLKGWSGDPGMWSVKDGSIYGDTFKKRTKANTFLIWDGEVEDFHLVYDAKIEGKNNSGMMYRSFYKNKETWRLSGYQADIHPNPPFVAMLYGEGLGKRGIIGRRGTKVHVGKDGKPKVVGKTSEVTKIDISKWHTYEVICRGNHLIHKVDGKVALDLIDDHPKKLLKGLIGMQLHSGPPMKAWFKNIRLKKFNSLQAKK